MARAFRVPVGGLLGLGAGLVAVVVLVSWSYSRLINLLIPAAHRPGRIVFPVQRVSDEEFERLARQLLEQQAPYTSVDVKPQNAPVYNEVARRLAGNVASFYRKAGLDHIDRFRKAGVREYRGPDTCLQCHQTERIKDGKRGYLTVNTRSNIEESIHF